MFDRFLLTHGYSALNSEIPRMYKLFADRSGAAMITFAIFLPVVLVLTAGGIDYARWLSLKADVQNAADAAVLAAAKEMRLGSANTSVVASAARSRALAALGELADTAKIQVSIPNQTTVSVQIDVTPQSLFGDLSPVKAMVIEATSAAQSASTPTCLITLDPKGHGLTIQSAAINANGCATYSDAQKPDGLKLQQGTLTAFQSCSAGGFQNNQGYAYPAPITDCPVITDPLASHPPPTYGGCDYYGEKVSGVATTLNPGVYCQGLTITQGATATLNPGVYIISGGPLAVDQNSTMQGNKVGFFLAGDKSQLKIDPLSTIDLVAPADGPMAGILFFEDRNAHPNRQHLLGSRNAPQLLGTLYFPQGQLSIGGKTPGPYDSQLSTDIANCAQLNLGYPCSPPQANVAQYSAWTIVIANSVSVNFVMNLVLNTNYSANSTKPPAEISFKGASLTQ